MDDAASFLRFRAEGLHKEAKWKTDELSRLRDQATTLEREIDERRQAAQDFRAAAAQLDATSMTPTAAAG